MRSRFTFSWIIAALVLIHAAVMSGAEVSVSIGGQRLDKQVKSFKALRQDGVAIQQLDYSCGAAALSTLLTYHFRDNVKETEVVGFIFIHGQTPEEGLKKYFRNNGFSLLDLKRFVEFRGYKSAGYKSMELNDLLEFIDIERVPVLVPIKPLGYNHFVIVRGIFGNRVFLADPAVGKTTMTIAHFLDIWVDGIGFVVMRKPVTEVSLKTIPSDSEMDQITAAGAALSRQPSDKATRAASAPSLMTIAPWEPFYTEAWRIMPVLEREATGAQPRIVSTYNDSLGRGLLTNFELQNFNPVLQLGQPAGNFIDFTPPRGHPIAIAPSSSSQ